MKNRKKRGSDRKKIVVQVTLILRVSAAILITTCHLPVRNLGEDTSNRIPVLKE
jgi:hypothetical protein